MKKNLFIIFSIIFLYFAFPNSTKAKINIYDENLYSNLKGKIVLRVEANGEAYYIHPEKQKMYYLGRPADAFKVMREQGIGISNKNLARILDDNIGGINNDIEFTNSQKGKILLAVEENGEAWYVNPSTLMRRHLGKPSDAFNIMRELGLGISEDNFFMMNSEAWRDYKNDKYDISFTYPASWGKVTTKIGNIDEEGTILCGYGSHRQFGPPDTVYLFDLEIKFSNSPNDENITILKYSEDKPVLNLCDEADKAINLIEDKNNFDNSIAVDNPYVEKEFFTNKNNLNILRYPYSTTYGTGVYSFYKSYSTQYEIEAKNYYNITNSEQNVIETYKDIIEWAKNDETANKLRKEFNDFFEVIHSININE